MESLILLENVVQLVWDSDVIFLVISKTHHIRHIPAYLAGIAHILLEVLSDP